MSSGISWAVGCLIAHALSPRLLLALAPRWPVMLGMNLALILGILGLGIVATRTRWLPGTAGIWGMSPGGTAAMVMLAEAYGSDKRLVAPSSAGISAWASRVRRCCSPG